MANSNVINWDEHIIELILVLGKYNLWNVIREGNVAAFKKCGG